MEPTKHKYVNVVRGLIRRHRIMVGITQDHAGRNLGPVDVIERKVAQIAKRLGAYSIHIGVGYWNGVAEDSLVVEYLGDENVLVTEVAEKIAEALQQEEVWVTSDSTFLTRVVRKEVI